MADTRTTHIELIKQDPQTQYDYEKQDANLEKLDDEIWARGKKFNGHAVEEDGEFHVSTVPFAENFESSASQKSNESYLIRTSGGEASISDGDAWLTLLKGNRRHDGYVAQEIDMQVVPMSRQADPAITAVLDDEIFEAYVGEAGTYVMTYTTGWDNNPADYGVTISNTPVSGDNIQIVWDGENEPVMTVNAVPRPVPESISAVMDEDVFVAYVQQSGTTTLTYSTAWSADPTLYGIIVSGTPVAGDVITVDYVKEVRGTIVQSNPQTFVSTGWNLYNHTLGYARVIKYSDEYAFKIAGTYTALEFATTPTGSRISITPISGYFSIPSDGYVFVTGGNATNTELWMTWSDWGIEPNGGVFAPYEQDVIDISAFMSTNFPYGLMQVGSIRDEINLNVGLATSAVARMTYNAENLAAAKASGREYEYDENYIYIEKAEYTSIEISVDGDYDAFDHGMEYFTGSDQAVYAETIYGTNLKNKLERDVLTISQQTLTSAQQDQVCQNLGIDRSTLRPVPFAVAVSDWSGSSSFTANFLTQYVTNASIELVVFDSSLKDYAKAHINSAKKSGGGGITFTTSKKPTGTITGTILVWANNDGKIPVLIEGTVTPIANGGTGQSSLSGAKQALGITALSEQIGTVIAKNKDCTITKLVINSTSFTVNIPNDNDCWINFYGTTYDVAAMDKKLITFSILIRNGGIHGTYVLENGEASSSFRVMGCSVSNGVATITTNVNFLMFGIAEAYSWT